MEAVSVARRRFGPFRELVQPVDARWMLGLVGVALLLRIIFVLAVTRNTFAPSDLLQYHTIAGNLADGNGFSGVDGAPTAQWPPAWPIALSFLYRIFGPDPQVGEVLNAVLGAATVALLYLTALRALGRPEAIFCGIFLAIMPGQIFVTDVLLAETFFTFVLVAFFATLVLAPRKSVWTVLALGALAGVATLTRAEGILLVVVAAVVWWREAPRREALRRTTIALAAVAVLVVPWTIRNAVAMHAFVPLSTNSGSTLWSGHNPRADGGPTYPSDTDVAPIEKYKNPQRELRLNTLLRQRALDWATTHPLRELQLIPEKFLSLIRGDSQLFFFWILPGPSKPPIGEGAAQRLSVLADAATYALFAAVVASIVVFGRALWANRLLLACIIYVAMLIGLYSFVFYGNFRYRIPLEPLMMLIAAPLAGRLWQIRRTRLRTSAR